MTAMRALDNGTSLRDVFSEHKLRSMGPRRTIAAGRTLFPLGRYPAFIEEGLVKLVTVDDQHGALLSIHGPGDLLGEEDVLARLCDRRIRPAIRGPDTTAIALTRASVRALQVQPLEQFLQSDPKALAAVALGLYERLDEAQALIASVGRDRADRRLARLLCDLERYGRPNPTALRGTQLPMVLSQVELASWVRASPKTIERAIARWHQRGIIYVQPPFMIVRDLETLARIAGVEVTRRAFMATA